jgi:hypothetical protein
VDMIGLALDMIGHPLDMIGRALYMIGRTPDMIGRVLYMLGMSLDMIGCDLLSRKWTRLNECLFRKDLPRFAWFTFRNEQLKRQLLISESCG